MTHQEITEGNQLIKEFMGSIIAIAQDDVKDIPLAFLKGPDLKFHLSWKWLMPVVIKIEQDDGGSVRIIKTTCAITKKEEQIVEMLANTKMEAVWQAVVS